jgi:PEP-CTERM motif
MRVRRSLGAALTSVVFFAAAPGADAVSLPARFTLGLEIANLGPVSVSSNGTATVNGSGPGGHVASLAVAPLQLSGTALFPVSDPAAAPITGVRLTVGNDAGAFAETAGGVLRGNMPLLGAAKVCLFGEGAACTAAVANINVPLGAVGGGGFQFITAAVNMTVFGAPWTTATAAIGTITRMGSASPASSTGMASGTVRLVTPVRLTTNIGASAVVPIFAVLTLHFVPEPTTLTLLASGVVALAWAGRSRQRD